MADPDPIEEAAWRGAAGDLRAEDLPGLATDALVRGLDSPSLRILAGHAPRDIDVSRELFGDVIGELGLPPRSTDDALWCLVRLTATRVVDGHTPPVEGARWIALHAARDVEEGGDLDSFLSLIIELDELPGRDIAIIEREIISLCDELLQQPAPRRRITLRAESDRPPLTRHGHQGPVDVPVLQLRLDAQLAGDVSRWAELYNAKLGQWPDTGGFRSPQDARNFVDQGRLLAARLQDALGPTYRIEYQPERLEGPGLKLEKRRWFRRRSS